MRERTVRYCSATGECGLIAATSNGCSVGTAARASTTGAACEATAASDGTTGAGAGASVAATGATGVGANVSRADEPSTRGDATGPAATGGAVVEWAGAGGKGTGGG